jgi:LEA14-like dessication related protein
MISRIFGALFIVSLAVLGQGCAQLNPHFENPQVTLESLEFLEQRGLSQRFRIGLRLINPNSRALAINGMSYTLSLNGFRLISGVSNRIPELAAYSETQLFLEAGTDLLEALRLLRSLTTQSQDPLHYELNAKLDLKGLAPTLNVRRIGTVNLGAELN